MGRRADEAGEVVEVEHPRRQVRAQVGAFSCGVDAGIAAQVAVAEGPGEVPVVPSRAVAAEAAVEFVRQRGWQREADQWIEVLEVLSGQGKLQIEIA